MTTSAEVRAVVFAQPAKEPGTPGWWRVWGASVQDILPGDFVFTKDDQDGFLVTETFVAKSIVKRGIVVDGERQTIGLGCPIYLLRQGTHNTLSPTVR
jgi:hypothetical protein